jgi:uncharacterized delta-60 repeat protein
MKNNLLKSLIITGFASVAGISSAQDGTLDVSFGSGGIVQTISAHEANDMVIQSDGKILVAGSILLTTGDMAVARYNTNGTLDNTFGTSGIANIDFNNSGDGAAAILIQSDGKIVLAGSTTNSSNNRDIAVTRLNTNGTLDNTFGTGGKFTLDVDGYNFDGAWDAELQSDGKIVIVAMAGTDMFSKTAVLRLNTNGTLDNSFDGDGILKAFSFGSFNLSSLHSLTIQPDGKILIAGSKNNNFAVARLNTDGSLDNTYGTSGVFSGTDMSTASRIYLQSDGKLLATYSHATQTSINVLRLNSNGTLDAGFGTGGKVSTSLGTPSTYDYALDLAIQPNGKIVVAGSSYSTTTISDFVVARYNTNGTIDNTFGATSNGTVITSVAATDEDRGKAVKLQSDGKIVVAGSKCTGSCDFVLLRYNNTAGSTGINDYTKMIQFDFYPNPANDFMTINLNDSFSNTKFNIVDINGKSVYSAVINEKQTLINTSHIVSGIYFLELTTADGYRTTKKLVITK